MDNIHHFCQGDSHKVTNKPCQDYAYSESNEYLSMAIVSDGHGGERYFRSQIGSELAVNITKEAIRNFVSSMEEASLNDKNTLSVFDNVPFTSFSQATASEEQFDTNAHQSLMWLFSSIINQWNMAIEKDAHERELTEWELENVDKKYIDEFLAKKEQENSSFEKTYGCTLMAYVQTPRYWFAFHLGDGKCITMHLNDGKLVCQQPIPWDEKCFLNKTTSLCDSNVLEEFRYCYQGNGESNFPIAVFLGSDGLDDSYGDGDNLYNFYIQLFKIIIRNGKEKALKELEKSLPVISQRGSKDDMSVACIFKTEAQKTIFFQLIDYQLSKTEEAFNNVESKIMELDVKIENFGNPEILDKSQQINLEYAKKDLAKAKELAKKLDYKQRALKGELTKFKSKFENNDTNNELLEDEESTLNINVSESE